MQQPDLSIVIGAYQEAKRIGRTLDDLATYLKAHPLGEVEVLVVVADSPDGTADIVNSKAGEFQSLRVVHPGPKVGKGRDIRAGMLEAKGKYRLFMDADLATPLNHLEDVRKFMQRGGDVAIGVRKLASTHKGLRRLISESGNLLVRLTLLPGISDSQCGFKVFSAEAAEEVFRRQTIVGWGFDMEILAIAQLLRYKVEKVSILDWVDVPNGTIHNEIKSAALQTLKDLGLIIWRKWTGKYKHRTFA